MHGHGLPHMHIIVHQTKPAPLALLLADKIQQPAVDFANLKKKSVTLFVRCDLTLITVGDDLSDCR